MAGNMNWRRSDPIYSTRRDRRDGNRPAEFHEERGRDRVNSRGDNRPDLVRWTTDGRMGYGRERSSSRPRPSSRRAITEDPKASFHVPTRTTRSEATSDPRRRINNTLTSTLLASPTALDATSHTPSGARNVNVPNAAVPTDTIMALLTNSNNASCHAYFLKREETRAQERLDQRKMEFEANKKDGLRGLFQEQAEADLKIAEKNLEDTMANRMQGDRASDEATRALADHMSRQQAQFASFHEENVILKQASEKTEENINAAKREIIALNETVMRISQLIPTLNRQVAEHSQHLALAKTDNMEKHGEMIQTVDFSDFEKQLKRLFDTQERFTQDQEEIDAQRKDDKVRIKNIYNAVFPPQEGTAPTSQISKLQAHMASLKTTVEGLSTTVESLNKQKTAIQVTKHSQNVHGQLPMTSKEAPISSTASLTRLSTKIDAVEKRVEMCLGDTEQIWDRLKGLGGLAEMLDELKGKFETCQDDVQEIKVDMPPKEKIISDNLMDVRARCNDVEDAIADFSKTVKQISVLLSTTDLQDLASQKAGIEACRAEVNDLLQNFGRLQKDVVDVPALKHALRALTQRYNNLTSEDLVQAMVGQLSTIFPHASNIQNSFDIITANATVLQGQQNSLVERITVVDECIAGMNERITNTSDVVSGKISELRNGVKIERDSVKAEFNKRIKAEVGQRASLEEDLKQKIRAEADQRESLWAASSTSFQERYDTVRAELNKRLQTLRDALVTEFGSAIQDQRDGLDTGFDAKLVELESSVQKQIKELVEQKFDELLKFKSKEGRSRDKNNEAAHPPTSLQNDEKNGGSSRRETSASNREHFDHLKPWQRRPSRSDGESQGSSESSEEPRLATRKTKSAASSSRSTPVDQDKSKKRKQDNSDDVILTGVRTKKRG